MASASLDSKRTSPRNAKLSAHLANYAADERQGMLGELVINKDRSNQWTMRLIVDGAINKYKRNVLKPVAP